MVIAELLPPPLTGGQKKSFERKDPKHEGVKLGLDWLAVTFHPTPKEIGYDPDQHFYGDEDPITRAMNTFRDQVLFAASLALGCDPGDWFDKPTGFYGYQRSMLGPEGAQLLYDPVNKNDGEHFNIFMPGKACALVSQDRMRSYLRFSIANEGVVTRCDVNIDDYSRIISPDQVRAVVQSSDAVTHAKEWLGANGGRVGSTEATGTTLYVGQPSSRQRLRVYDKGQESGGEIDAIRWEIQTRKEPARTLVAALAERDWAEVITERLVTFIDFRNAESAARIQDRVRLPWYSKLVSMAERASAYLPKAARSVNDVIAWIDKQVGTSLAVAARHWRGDLAPLFEIFQGGEERFKPKHLAMLARAG